VNGRAVARTFLARGHSVVLWDAQPGRAEAVGAELGAEVARSLPEALAADVVATVTPGREILLTPGTLRAGQHVSLMGADGSGKAEIAVEELLRPRVVCDDCKQPVPDRTPTARVRLFCDDWEQARQSGDIARAVESGRLGRDGVAELGRVLAGEETGRTSEDEITVFDSTGLAVQDLAVALAVYERYESDPGGEAFADVVQMEVG